MSLPYLNLQAIFIDDLIQNQTQTLVYLQNNICMNGFLLSHDERVLVIKDKNGMQIFYKDAIASIVPNLKAWD